MSDTNSSEAPLLRDDSETFDALRDGAAERFAIDSGAVEKEYWALEVLRAATAPLDGVDEFVFKGGTSLSKAYGIIERFSEDIDLLVITTATGKALKRVLRAVADRTSTDLGIEHERAHEGRGFLNARYTYPARREVGFLSPGVLLEMGSRGGPLPNQRRSVQSLMADAAVIINPEAATRYVDLAAFEVTVLAPERTLAEKLAFLHHRASTNDLTALAAGARHLYDVAMLLSNADVRNALQNPDVIRELMIDIDARSDAAGWPYTPRPEAGFASSPAFTDAPRITNALNSGYARLDDLVWGHRLSFAEAIDIVRTHHGLI